jgi:hypothetical protein
VKLGTGRYNPDTRFFGGEHNNFVILCFIDMKTSKEKKTLKMGDGYGGDAVFFAFKGLLMSGAESRSSRLQTVAQ